MQLTWGAGGESNSRAPTQVHSLAAGALSRALAEVTKQGQGQPWVQVQSRPKKAFRPVVYAQARADPAESGVHSLLPSVPW